MNRRQFLATSAVTAVALQAAVPASEIRSKPLKASYWGPEYYGEEEQQQLDEVLSSRSPFRWYGPNGRIPMKVLTFEKEFAERMQTRYTLAVTSGTAALQCAVNALQVGPGDEVILPAWTWHSCYTAILLAGGLPVFAEIDKSFNIDPDDIENHITPRTKAIMVVHLQGNPADLDRILPIARKHNLRIIEDCAQSLGASYKGRPVGSIGDIGIYSLQLNKTITAGEGGAVVTNDPVLFERASRFHDLGALRAPHEKIVGKAQGDWFIGSQFRMNEFSGGVLLAQLRKLDTIVGAIRANARRVYDGVRDLPGIRVRKLPDPAGEPGSAVFLGLDGETQSERLKAASAAEKGPLGHH